MTVEWLPMREEDQMNRNQKRGQLALDGLQKLTEPSHESWDPEESSSDAATHSLPVGKMHQHHRGGLGKSGSCQWT
jgi:hypothetical protein